MMTLLNFIASEPFLRPKTHQVHPETLSQSEINLGPNNCNCKSTLNYLMYQKLLPILLSKLMKLFLLFYAHSDAINIHLPIYLYFIFHFYCFIKNKTTEKERL